MKRRKAESESMMVNGDFTDLSDDELLERLAEKLSKIEDEPLINLQNDYYIKVRELDGKTRTQDHVYKCWQIVRDELVRRLESSREAD